MDNKFNMKNNKSSRIFAMALAFVMVFTSLICMTGCGGDDNNATEGFNVVCVGFSEYDWTMNIMGEAAADANVTYLASNGVDMHSFQPTTKDIALLTDADIIMYAGGPSQAWLDDIAATRNEADGKYTLCFMDVLGDSILEEELVEGMQEEEEEEEEEGPELDEHTWLSLVNAVDCCRSIRDALCKADPDNQQIYANNCDDYTNALYDLDMSFEEGLAGAQKATVVFGDRFPFRYMMEDYDIQYFAAFPGCAAESEASFETVIFLANKVKELNLPVVLELENSKNNIAGSVKDNAGTNPEILTMNSLQSVSQADIDAGATYLGIMGENLKVLEKALMCEAL